MVVLKSERDGFRKVVVDFEKLKSFGFDSPEAITAQPAVRHKSTQLNSIAMLMSELLNHAPIDLNKIMENS